MTDRPLETAAARIGYAIEKSGLTLEVLAEAIGCSHAALSQWRSGTTNAANIKAGLLNAFAERTATDVRWLLTGEGVAVSRYILTDELARAAVSLAAMERQSHEQVEIVVQIVEAAARRSQKLS